jgi:GntR family transcriptional regulator/MocR family aminotransferase
MGVTSLDENKIREGVAKLAKLIRKLSSNQIDQRSDLSGQLLSGDEIRQQLSGATLLTKTVYGAPCTFELKPDGKLLGVAGQEDEEHDQGRWWIEGDRWFRQWEDWAYGEKLGFYVSIENNMISWINQDGRATDSAEIRRPEA